MSWSRPYRLTVQEQKKLAQDTTKRQKAAATAGAATAGVANCEGLPEVVKELLQPNGKNVPQQATAVQTAVLTAPGQASSSSVQKRTHKAAFGAPHAEASIYTEVLFVALPP